MVAGLPEQPIYQSPTDHVLAFAERRAVIGVWSECPLAAVLAVLGVLVDDLKLQVAIH